MPFNTLEEANAFEIQHNEMVENHKKSTDILNTKISDLETKLNDSTKNINDLKLNNYELMIKLSTQKENVSTGTKETKTEDTTKITDILSDI